MRVPLEAAQNSQQNSLRFQCVIVMTGVECCGYGLLSYVALLYETRLYVALLCETLLYVVLLYVIVVCDTIVCGIVGMRHCCM